MAFDGIMRRIIDEALQHLPFFRNHPLFARRLVAKAIDLAIVLFLAALPLYPLGPLLAFAYILSADGYEGRSVGKRLLGLVVIYTEAGAPARYRDSFVRNSTVAVPVLFFMVPIVGWFLWILIGIPILAIELYLMTRLEAQARLGDTMADTKVSEWVAT